MTAGEEAGEFPLDAIERMNEGIDQEETVRRYLETLGFNLSRPMKPMAVREYNISGKPDFFTVYDGVDYLLEVKTVAGYSYDKLNTPQDFIDGEWHKRWYGQLQIYLLMYGLENGAFIIKDREAKRIKVVEVKLDFAYAEKLLQNAEVVMSAIQDDTPPPFIANTLKCKKCAFFQRTCHPPMDFGESIKNIEDPALINKLIRREQLDPLRKEWKDLDEEVKELFKNVPQLIVGPFMITGKQNKVGWKTEIERLTQ